MKTPSTHIELQVFLYKLGIRSARHVNWKVSFNGMEIMKPGVYTQIVVE